MAITVVKEVTFYCDKRIDHNCNIEYHVLLRHGDRIARAFAYAQKFGWVIDDDDNVTCPYCQEQIEKEK